MFKRWLHFLTEIDGRSLKEQNGVITSSSQRTPLDPTPEGWMDVSFGYERDLETIGNVRRFSLPLGFFRTAAKILRHEYYKKNIERRLFFLITKLYLDVDLIAGTYKRYYKTIHKGEVDLSSFKDEENKCTINLLEGGISQQLKAKKGTVYEIPMDDPEMIWVKMDGVLLSMKQNWLITESTQIEVFGDGIHLIGAVKTTSEGEASGFASFDVFFDKNQPSDLTTDQRYLFTTTQAITAMNVKGSIKVADLVAGSYNYKAQLKSSAGQTIDLVNATLDGEMTFDFDVDINSAVDEKWFLIGSKGSGATATLQYRESTFTVSFTSRYKTTYVKALKPSTVFKRLTGKITGSEDNAVSNLITSNDSYALSCIDAVRGLEKPIMKTHMNNFYTFCKVLMCAGMGIENNKIRIEAFEHFLQTSDVISLGEVKGLEITNANELIANTFKIGYDQNSNDNVNGKYEFNNTHLYEGPITKVVKSYDLVSPYRADAYGIEALRINLDGKTTTDNDSDNDVCILHVDLDNPQTDIDLGITYYNLKRVPYDNWNLPDDFRLPSPETAFNIEIRPEILLRKHLKWINSMNYGFAGDKLKYQTTEKNTIKTVQGSTVIDGKADVTLTNDLLFIPKWLTFETDVEAIVLELISQNPNTCFEFTWKGETYQGYSWDIVITPDTLKEQSFKLLATPNNNFLNLIHG